MKPFKTVLAILTLSITLGAAQNDKIVYRDFTSRDGKTLKAYIQSKTDIAVTLKREDGKTFTLPVTNLSDDDQSYIRRWDPLQEKFRRDFSTLSVRQLLEARGYQSFEYYIEGNHIFVDGELNGTKMRFMIDTGAGGTTLDLKAATDTECEIGPFTETVIGVAGEAPAASTMVRSIRVGDALFENRRLLTVDMFKIYREKGYAGANSYGIIFGADFLREVDAVISYKENRVFLKPQ